MEGDKHSSQWFFDLVGERGVIDKQLFDAVKSGDIVRVSALLGQKQVAFASAVDIKNKTPLHYALANGRMEIAKMIVKAGCVNLNNEGWTVLHEAADKANLDLARFVIEALNDSKQNVIFLNSRTKAPGGETPLHRAAENCDGFNVADLIIKSGGLESVFIGDHNGQLPLHRAATKGHLKTAELLLEAGGIDTAFGKDTQLKTPLHWAVVRGHVDIVNLLVQTGGSGLVNEQDHFGSTSLHCAAEIDQCDNRNDSIEIFRILIKGGANLEATNRTGETALHKAAASQSLIEFGLDAVRLLLKQGANINAQCDLGETPLDKAIDCGNIEIANYLKRKGGLRLADLVEKSGGINFEVKFKRTAIHYAAIHGYVELAELLLKTAAETSFDVVNLKDSEGWTPLHWAARFGHLNVVRLLVENGADLNSKNDQGKTPTDLAYRNDALLGYLKEIILK